jgi:hypothetical protein
VASIPDPGAQQIYGDCEKVDRPVIMDHLRPDPAAQDRQLFSVDRHTKIDSVRNLGILFDRGNLEVKRSESVNIMTLWGKASLVSRVVSIASDFSSELNINATLVNPITASTGRLNITADYAGSVGAHSGPLCIAANEIGPIDGVGGPVVLIGRPSHDPKHSSRPRAFIDHVGDVRGVLILKNIDALSVSTIYSHMIVLEDANVGFLSGFAGTIYEHNSHVRVPLSPFIKIVHF